MLHGLGVLKKNQGGFTLIEVIVAIVITSIVGVGVTMAISQVFNVNALSNNRITAVKQLENAIYWLNRDAQMAQIVQPNGDAGFPLNLSWVEWDNTTHQVSYTLEDSELHRNHSINGSEPIQNVVATHINSDVDMTNCQFVDGVFTFKVTASVSGFRSINETHIAQVIPRPAP